jgi:hypothetical protein
MKSTKLLLWIAFLLFPFLFAGGSFWCSLPGGCLVGIDAITSIQVDASVGVIFAF